MKKFNFHPVEHFKTITEHKKLVAEGCFKVGLYRQGILHDLSKYMPEEFMVGALFYQGNRSPNNAEREKKGYSAAWLHHKGRNKHHYEYWVDYSSQTNGGAFIPVKMPLKFVIEMLMDRVAASKVYNGENYRDDMPLQYFSRSMDTIIMHPETKKLLYALLRMLSVYGEEKTFNYIKRRLLRNGTY
ncbi:MAG: DUF5662 family protein [Lachnospiraceae bacterium]|nr:DUF5662 family protein [Lachnospiraceae bacterium]